MVSKVLKYTYYFVGFLYTFLFTYNIKALTHCFLKNKLVVQLLLQLIIHYFEYSFPIEIDGSYFSIEIRTNIN